MSSNTDRLFEAGFLVGDRPDVPPSFESFLETLSPEEVTSLITVKEKLDEAGISIGPSPELSPGKMVYGGGGGVL